MPSVRDRASAITSPDGATPPRTVPDTPITTNRRPPDLEDPLMTRRITSEGDTLHEALIEALAELADCDPEEVELSLAAPGLDVAEPVDLDLRLRVVADADVDRDVDDEDEDDEDDDRDASEHEEDASEEDEAPVDLQAELDEEADAAADFMEELLDILELPGDLKLRVFEDYAEVELLDVGSGVLIGRRGQTLEAIQELLRCSLQRQFQRRTHVKVDIEGYRTRRLEKLLSKAEESIDAVLDRGQPERLEPMDVFERKAIHHLVAEVEGVSSRSQGREPGRRVIIEPAD